MPCYHPILAWQIKGESKSSPLFFHAVPGSDPLYIPCGKCIGCRLDRSRQWAIRCVAEAQMNDKNCFVTLTYNDDHCPKDMSLKPKDLTLFFKRLRKNIGSFRYFACGEYGDHTARPHYHACIFGLDFSDDLELKTEICNGRVSQYAHSPTLESIWKFGNSQVGNLTWESAAYVARYTLKKMYGDAKSKAAHYGKRKEEYVVMSRRPGIGYDWFERYFSQTYPRDMVLSRGYPSKPPRYYDKLLERRDPAMLAAVKSLRVPEFTLPDMEQLSRSEEYKEICQAKISRGL